MIPTSSSSHHSPTTFRSSFMIYLVITILVCFFTLSHASIHTRAQPRSLILFSNPSFKNDYSEFIASLSSRHHDISFINPYFDGVKLLNFGRSLYDNVFVFSSAIPPTLPNFPPAEEWINFVAHGGSLFVAPENGQLSSIFRQVGEAYGVTYFPTSSTLLDTARPASAFVTVSRSAQVADAILGRVDATTSPTTASLAIHGTAMSIVDNVPYTKRVIAAPPTTVVLDGTNDSILDQGLHISLLSVVQLKNNARILFLSDISMLSDNILLQTNTINHQTLLHSVCWAVHDCGHIRVRSLHHYAFEPSDFARAANPYINQHVQQLTAPVVRRDDENEPEFRLDPPSYKVGEHVHVDLLLEQYNGYTKQWDLITSPDLILDVTMLHPYVRFPLQLTSPRVQHAREVGIFAGSTVQQYNHATELTLPDTMGVYKLSFNTYQTFPNSNSQGHSFLSCEAETPVVLPVRPYEHHQWARFLFPAYPYYLGMIITMGLFFAFSVMFLYTK